MSIIPGKSKTAVQKGDLIYPKANLNYGDPKGLSLKCDVTQCLAHTYSVFFESIYTPTSYLCI